MDYLVRGAKGDKDERVKNIYGRGHPPKGTVYTLWESQESPFKARMAENLGGEKGIQVHEA